MLLSNFLTITLPSNYRPSRHCYGQLATTDWHCLILLQRLLSAKTNVFLNLHFNVPNSELTRSSPEHTAMRLQTSLNRSRADSFYGPCVSNAIGWNRNTNLRRHVSIFVFLRVAVVIIDRQGRLSPLEQMTQPLPPSISIPAFLPLPFLPLSFTSSFPSPFPIPIPQIQLGDLGSSLSSPSKALATNAFWRIYESQNTSWMAASFSFPPNISCDAKCVIPPRFRSPCW